MLRLQRQRRGDGNWRVVDARLDLDENQLWARLTAVQRQRLRLAEASNRQVFHLWQQGRSAEALPLAQKALLARRKILGEKHRDTAQSWLNLGAQHAVLGQVDQARRCYREAMVIHREVLGENHPLYAYSLSNLGLLDRETGEHAKALPLLREALKLRRRLLGEQHPDYATSLNNLAMLYKDLGEHARALPLLLEAHDVIRKVQGEKHPSYANNLNNLAGLYKEMGEHKKALPLYLKARELLRKTVGEKHHRYADSLNNLALLYEDMGEETKALPLLLQARDLRRKLQGEKHPLYAGVLNNLAGLYQALGEHAKALPLLKEARDRMRETVGQKHPFYATTLSSLATLYLAMGKPRQALAPARQAWQILDGYLEDSFDHLGEQQRLQLTETVLHHLGFLLSVQEETGQSAASCYAAVLAWKGRVMAHRKLELLARDEPDLVKPLRELQAVRWQLARLAPQTPSGTLEPWLKQLRALAEEKERLESELSLSAAFRRHKQRQRLTPEQLSREMPAGVALVDLLEYVHYRAPEAGKGKAPGERRLLAFVVLRGQEPVLVSLGPMQPIVDAVANWRQEVQQPSARSSRERLARAGKALRQRVWQPLSKHLVGVNTVLVAPDGVLCQLPFAALPGSKQNSYLIEEVAIAQLASAGQLFDLLHPAAQKPKHQTRALLAVGGVDYGAGRKYPPLPGTRREVEHCRDLFHRAFPAAPVTLLTGKEATVSAVQRSIKEKPPAWLHLATHGFFEPPERVLALRKGLVAGTDHLTLWREHTTFQSLPLLRCGLALAGANRESSDENFRAVLTGEDVEGLDLRGCELAVLSACQTGLGDLKQTQGVVGLQRAFHAAGAKTLLTSLWSVSDEATQALMGRFYAHLLGGRKMTRLEALRQAQLDMLARGLRDPVVVRGLVNPKTGAGKRLPPGKDFGGRLAPAYWAAFVLSGEWR
jgi:CHAT domain-containing protein